MYYNKKKNTHPSNNISHQIVLSLSLCKVWEEVCLALVFSASDSVWCGRCLRSKLPRLCHPALHHRNYSVGCDNQCICAR